jgi:hypothetical protein
MSNQLFKPVKLVLHTHFIMPYPYTLQYALQESNKPSYTRALSARKALGMKQFITDKFTTYKEVYEKRSWAN